MGRVPVLHVVLMVARHKNHRAGPVGKPLQPKVLALQQTARLIGANVSGQHQYIGIGGGLRHKVGMHFQMKIREQLKFHSPHPKGITTARGA